MIIPDGVYTIVHRFGADVSSNFAPGLHLLPPWYKVVFLVTRQSCAYNAPVKGSPTKDNVICGVDLTLVFRIVDPAKFVYELGARKFDVLLKAATEDAIRGMVREITHDKIYEMRGSKAGEFLKYLNSQFDRYGVSFSDATITNVVLPPDLAEALQKETTYESMGNEQRRKHAFNIKVLNDKADLVLKNEKAELQRQTADLMAKKQRLLIKKEQSEIDTQREKQLAIIKAQQNISVLLLRAQADVENSKIHAEKDAAVIVENSRARCAAAKIKADQEAKAMILQSEAALNAAQNFASAVLVEAEAEGAAAEKLAQKRKYDLQLARTQALQSLSSHGKFLVGNNQGDRLIKALLLAQ